MSPASQGSLEVERYIGSNLISSCARVKNNGKSRKNDGKLVLQRSNVNQNGETFHCHPVSDRQNYPVPSLLSPCGCRNVGVRSGQFGGGTAGWTTGMPLISVAGDGKKKNQFQDRQKNLAPEDDSSLRTPLSRLAIHTQGAPLILSGRCYNGRKNQNRGNQVRGSRGDLIVRRSNKYKDNHSHGHGGTSDCLSVASDESSGSGHSENCLPRIIKPRKRRKKDRKPSAPSNEEAIVAGGTDIPKAPCEQKAETEVADVKSPQKCDTKPNLKISNGSQRDEGSEDESLGPKLHHAFEDVTESESPPYGCLPSSCQCHYCDPSGIWNAPSSLFSTENENSSSSPFLTPPPDTTKSFHYFPHSELVLRRSWSEPKPELGKTFEQPLYGLPLRSNSFSDAKTTKWPGNRWDAVLKKKGKENPPIEKSDSEECGGKSKSKEKVYGSQCLEVSTEIVTSPNGHRDIEIRFYSTTTTTTTTAAEAVAATTSS